jgi:hypothetical protein
MFFTGLRACDNPIPNIHIAESVSKPWSMQACGVVWGWCVAAGVSETQTFDEGVRQASKRG